MKIIYTVIAIILMAASTASAQIGLGLNLSAGGGLSLPVSDLSGNWKTGYHGMAAISFSRIPQMEPAVRYAYHRFAAKNDAGSGTHLTIQEYGLDLKVKLSPPGLGVKPYALVGAGAAKAKLSDDSSSTISFSGTKFYYAFGGGILIGLIPRVDFFTEIRYTRISVSSGSVGCVPITVGLNLGI